MAASTSTKPRIAAAVQRLLSPVLLARGFVIEVLPGKPLPKWRAEAAFVRRKADGEDVIRLGPMKFGKRLGLVIARKRGAGPYAGMHWDKLGLAMEDLSYSNHAELETAILRILHLLEQQGFAWLDE